MESETLNVIRNTEGNIKHDGLIIIDRGVLVEGDITSTGDSVINWGTVEGAVTARNNLDNDGSIGSDAKAGDRLVNHGKIHGGAVADGDIKNSGVVLSAKAKGDIDNSGLIKTFAKAEGNLFNDKDGIIGGNVGAEKATNNGSVGADIDTKTSVKIGRGGVVMGSATSAKVVVEDKGSVIGNVVAKEIENRGTIGGTKTITAKKDVIKGGTASAENITVEATNKGLSPTKGRAP